MTKLFGTDGMRGEAGSFPLDAGTVRKVGSSLTKRLREQLGGRVPLIVIGRDTRESGSWIERSLVAGALVAGATCKSAGVMTTPGVAFLARSLPADAGVVISASHNPYQDNGIKVFSPSGKKLDDATERLIEADITEGAALRPPQNEEGLNFCEDNSADFHKRYLSFLVNEIGAGLSLHGLSITVDCANGAASQLAPELFERLGASVKTINNQPDGRNINRDCGSLHIDGLRHKVLEFRADLGVAFDGDADRALFVDAEGNLVDGDATLWVLASYLDKRGKLDHGIVVATVMSNIGLEIALRSRGVRLLRTDVGDKYVIDELIRRGAILGGEQSGHLIFPRLSLAGDGLITAICLLRALREESKSLAQLTKGFERYPQTLVNVKVREKRPFSEIEPVLALVREVEGKLSDRGRLLLRYSGTESLARVMIEGRSQSEIETHANALAEVIRKEIG